MTGWAPVSGLLLHTISPRLADRLFPVITSPAAEAVLNLILVFGLVTGSLLIFFRSVSAAWVHASGVLFLPSLQRLALLDQRVFRLQLRQFETIFLLGRLLILHILFGCHLALVCSSAGPPGISLTLLLPGVLPANFLAGYPATVLLANAEAKAWTHYM